MLFDVAALLITSAALGPAAEAFGVSENSSITITVPAAAGGLPPLSPVFDAVTIGSPGNPAAISHPISLTTFEVAHTGNSALKALTGVPLLSALAGLPRSRIASFISANPSAVTKLLASPPAARDVSNFWQSLDPSAQKALSASAPRLVGNLDGFPSAVRNADNRRWMEQSMRSLTTEMAKIGGRAQSADAQHQLQMLDEVKAALRTTKSGPPRSLLSVNPSGQGTAAIVIGNLKTADYVTYMVPGMFFKVDGQIDAWANDATDLYNEQVSWLKRLDTTKPGEAKKTVAVVAWMGYQTPDLTNIGSLDLAYQGRDALARAVEGMQAERAGNQPYTTILAHSYGSTAALMALTEYDFKIDALAVVGCPGSAAQSVKDLHVRNGNVFVGAAAWDPVPNSAWFGSDPSSPSYGAKTMAVGGGIDPITHQTLGGSIGHNEYFDAGSESLRNMALIGIDEGKLVVR